MKKLNYVVIVLMSLFLGACTHNQSMDVQLSSIQESIENDETSTIYSEDYSSQELYDDILSRYTQLVNGGDITSLFGDSSGEEAEAAWLVEDGITCAHINFQYSFFDINNDGKDELFIGTPEGVLTIYYLNSDNRVTITRAAGVASVGGFRAGFSIYTEGTISYAFGSSAYPDWEALTYQIIDSSFDELNHIYYKIGDDSSGSIEEQLGLTGKTQVDLSSLEWQDFD